MRILIEAHHPGDIHFWKYPIKELQECGHEVLMIGRDRDVMSHLLKVYDWIHYIIPPRPSQKNRFPLVEMIHRQWVVGREILRFKPDVVASLFGSYAQTAKVFGVQSVIFTDSEFQHFNHRIAHPFADEIHTPYCFYKDIGAKRISYQGIHELSFLHPKRFQPNVQVLKAYPQLEAGNYILIRLSAWNTLHDLNQSGVGEELEKFVKKYAESFQIVINAEEDKVPESLKRYTCAIAPEDFHQLLCHAAFVLSEGASTASEAACLGVPTVYINSTEPRGYLNMLEGYGLVRSFARGKEGVQFAINWLEEMSSNELDRLNRSKEKMLSEHIDVTEYVVRTLLNKEK